MQTTSKITSFLFLKCHTAIEKSNTASLLSSLDSWFLVFILGAFSCFKLGLGTIRALEEYCEFIINSVYSNRKLSDEKMMETVLLPLTKSKWLCPSLVLFSNQKSFVFLLAQETASLRFDFNFQNCE